MWQACCDWKEPAYERTPRTAIHQPWPGVIAAYRDRLPVGDDWTPVTLLEGGTPLIAATRLSEKTGCTVHLKVEGLNPTGSFKDRGMTMAVTDAVARGQQAVLCASTGNTSASAAAYAARAGITCAVLIPQGKIAMGKLAQAVMHGAKIIQIDGNFDDCLELARKMAADFPTISLVNSVNPVRIEGQKTAAFEIVDALGTAPDVHALPVGNAGNITAYWKGYTEYHQRGRDRQAAPHAGHPGRGRGAAGTRRAGQQPRDHRDRDPHRRTGVVDGRRRGTAAIQRALPGRHRRGDPGRIPPGGPSPKASSSSPRPRPASRACSRPIDDGWVARGSTVVCTVTGNGLKDPDTALKDMPQRVRRCRSIRCSCVEKLGLA